MKLKIGPFRYKVVRKDNMSDWGEANHGKTQITINKELHAQQFKETLWHEVLHTLLLQLGKKDLSRDEELVDGLAHSVMAFLKDNPDFR